MGGTVILISQGVTTSLALNEEKEMLDLASKHRVQVFTVSIPRRPANDISLSLERLAHNTGGQSFFVSSSGHSSEAEERLQTYVGLVDAFREIQARATNDGPYLVRKSSLDSRLH